ncbi:MAG: acetylglutamate kinase [Nitrospirae bacterium]|nr:acetylglutamate kinase [Nitrospirota bacterium]
MEDLIAKAGVLIEALPYIRTFYKKTFVIKYGGAAQVREDLKESFARDIVLFNYIGINAVIVHGGGPQISSLMKRLGKEPVFVEGYRVTDEDTMGLVEMVLGGAINKEIVSLINRHGGRAVGLSGKDANLISAMRKAPKRVITAPGVEEKVDLGLVGDIESVNPSILKALEDTGFIPVIAPIGFSHEGETLNINADFAAASIAAALKAEKLILLTDVPGILDKAGKPMSTIQKADVQMHITEGTITGGMIPKVTACLDALDEGVTKAHIIDGRTPHSLLLEIFTTQGIGTEIVL